jgi:hypothetical protein
MAKVYRVSPKVTTAITSHRITAMYRIICTPKLTYTSDSLTQAIWIGQVNGGARIKSSYGDLVVCGNVVMASNDKCRRLKPASSSLVMMMCAYLLGR